MIDWEEALENPEWMIKYKDYLIDEKIFKDPWCDVFYQYPYLYREFSYRFDEMDGIDIACAIFEDLTMISELKEHLHKLTKDGIAHLVEHIPSLILDLRDYLHKMSEEYVDWLLRRRPELSLCIKYKDDPNKVEAAYYITFPHELINMNKEEKREMGKRIIELLREEKT